MPSSAADSLPTSVPPAVPAQRSLSRTLSSTSAEHVQFSLRRLTTHETGEERGLARHIETEEEAVRNDEESQIASSASDKGSAVEAGKEKFELQDQTNLLPLKQLILVFIGLSAALFCSLLDQTIVSTALPTLGRVFNRADIVSWVGTAYLLTSTAAQPLLGRLSDIFGRKSCLLACLAIFFIGSIACAVAQTLIQLIIFRAIQGLGGGGIITLAMIIISDVVTLKERGKYQGFVGVIICIGNSLGPVLGGIFTEKASWRWCFYISLPITFVSIVIVIFVLPFKPVKGSWRSKLKQLDYIGSALTLVWAVLILLGLSWGGITFAWDSAAVLCCLVFGLVLLALFIWIEARVVKLPIIPMHIFLNVTVSAAMLVTLFSGMAFFATLYFLPNYFQVVQGVSASRSGVLLLPLLTVQTVCSFVSGLIVSKTGDYRHNLWIGFVLWSIGLGLLSTMDRHTSTAKTIGYQLITACGAGPTFQTSLIAIQAAVARKDMAVASGARNFLRQLGGTIALAASSAILTNTVKQNLQRTSLSANVINAIIEDPTGIRGMAISDQDKLAAIDAYTQGLRGIFLMLAPLAGVSAVITLLFIKANSLKRDDDAAQKEAGKVWAAERAHKDKEAPSRRESAEAQ